MQKHNYFGFEVEIDENATREWYSKSETWDCECGPCRNFMALEKRKQLPAPVLEILDTLGIPPEKATYVCQLICNDLCQV